MRGTDRLSIGTKGFLASLVAGCLALLGCSGADSAAGPEVAQISDAALVATWTTDLEVQGAPLQLVMEVSGDHSMIVHIKSPVPAPGGGTVMMEVQRHYITWSLNDNVLKSEWTSCQAADANGQLQDAPCAVAAESSPVALNGKSLTVLKGGQTLVFTRD